MSNPRAIEGVIVKPLRKILDERGHIMHMLKKEDPEFMGFGEIYFSTIFPNVVKAWHLHDRMTLHYAVVFGNIKLVLFDQRPQSPTRGVVQELFLGDDNHSLVRVPPGVINGFKSIGNQKAIVANCTDISHDPLEITRMDPFTKDVPYDWNLKHG